MISPVSQHSDELTMSQELAAGNITKMDLGTGGGSECWKFTLAQHDTAPAAPASQLFAQSSNSSCRNTPGAEVSTSRDPQKKNLHPLPQCFIVASGPKLQLSPIRAPSCKARPGEVSRPFISLHPTHSFTPCTVATC